MGPEDAKRLRQSRIQLFTRMKLRNIFPGEWESVFAGKGIEFAAIKPFEPGDDLRDLHLQALVQSGEEKILQRAVGRQRKIFIWADWSGSLQRSEELFFSAKPEMWDIAIGLLLYSAWNAYSPVGLCVFDTEIRRFFPARYGESYCEEILNWVADQGCQGSRAGVDVPSAISGLMARVSPQSLVFFVSDFEARTFEEDFTALLRPVTKKVDLVPVIIRDPLLKVAHLKRSVSITVQDSEGSGNAEIYLTPPKLKELQDISARHLGHLERNFRQAGIEPVVLDSPKIEDCYQVLANYFEARKRTKV